MFSNADFSNLKIKTIKDKKVYIVDQHQYTLPIWAYESLIKNMSFELVSIDYHPDTNPPFWQEAYYEAIIKDDEKVEELTKKIIQRKIKEINPMEISEIINLPKHLSNDEHINTAIQLGYLSDYHMLNCMDEHIYDVGIHYLIQKKHFSSLEDKMFENINFKFPKNKFILDIDLDYFSKMSSFKIESNSIIKKLVKEAEFVTIARSRKYFEYLKKPQEDFTLETCEKLCLKMISNYLT